MNNIGRRLNTLNNHIISINKTSNFKLEDVKTHNTEKDAWIIINNKIYDVTNFLSEHPGGKMILLKACGTDATDDFEMLHNPKVLKDYSSYIKYIGDI